MDSHDPSIESGRAQARANVLSALMDSSERNRIISAASFCAVFVAALLVRFAFVNELRDDSHLGNIRVSDAETYYKLAQQIVAGTAPAEPYWQAPLYPFVLALFQSLFGNSLHAAQSFHLSIGALNCALLFRLTDVLFGTRVAWAAAGVGVLYAPFWIFDVQPLPANLTVLLDLALVSFYIRFRENGGWVSLASAGLMLGLAIATHGLAVFTLPVFLYDLVAHRREDPMRSPSIAVCVTIFLAMTALAPGAVSFRNSVVAKAPVFVSYNAGINLYVGNSRNLEQTLARRGGYEWGELFRGPYTSGAKAPEDLNRYFVARTINELVDAPASVARTFGEKVLMTLAASEQKRNFPIYPLRESSSLLSAFLFEVEAWGGVLFAFPGGLVIPLSILGFIGLGRQPRAPSSMISIRALPGWVALFHVVGMLIFFPTARYRVPAVMLLLPYAGAALVTIWDSRPRRPQEGSGTAARIAPSTVIVALFLLVLVNPLASNVFRHPVQERAEHHYFTARWDADKTRYVKSESLEARVIATANESIRVDPTYPEPVELLALYYLDRDIDRSIVYFERLDQLVPNDGDVRNKLRAARAIRDERLRASSVHEPAQN